MNGGKRALALIAGTLILAFGLVFALAALGPLWLLLIPILLSVPFWRIVDVDQRWTLIDEGIEASTALRAFRYQLKTPKRSRV